MPSKQAQQSSGALRGIFLDNLGLKVVSLATALAIFWLVRGAEEAQRAVFVDVVAVTPPATSDRMLTSDLPAKVRVTLRGSRSILNALRADDIPPVQVDLSSTTASLYYFDPEAFEVPGGTEIVQIAPPTLPLSWAERATQTVPIVAAIEGSPDSGLMIAGTPLVRPASVNLTGPAPDLAAIERVMTEPVAVGGLPAGRYERRVTITRLPSHVDVIGERTVTVSFELQPEVAERSVPRLEIAVVGGLVREIRPSRVRVTLRGPPRVLDAMDAPSIVPFVDVSGLAEGAVTQAVPVRVRGIPDGVELVRVEPEDALVTPAVTAAHH
jgi:YbbR domain-containing protein